MMLFNIAKFEPWFYLKKKKKKKKKMKFLSGVHWTVLLLFLFSFRGITVLCVSSPTFGDFLYYMKVEAIPVKDKKTFFS